MVSACSDLAPKRAARVRRALRRRVGILLYLAAPCSGEGNLQRRLLLRASFKPHRMAHKLLIIQPSNYLSKRDRTVLKVRRRRVVPLTLPYLAALTPEGWDITLVDEQLHPVPFDERFDVAAVSCATLTSFRAYDVADEFRRRGVPVLLGGPHTFFHSEEAGEHCDAVGIGEAEPIWATMNRGRPSRTAGQALPGRAAPQPGRPAAAALRPPGPPTLPSLRDLHHRLLAGLPLSVRILFRTLPAR